MDLLFQQTGPKVLTSGTRLYKWGHREQPSGATLPSDLDQVKRQPSPSSCRQPTVSKRVASHFTST
jgi:hypothetical protein